jgi:DNA modification methylase
MSFEIKEGDALSVLREMPDESVQTCVTSPPYYGLRDYNSPPSIWGGSADCDHEWIEQITPAANGLVNNDMQGETLSATSATRKPRRSDFCSKCDAWKGCLGLEPTPQLFVKNLVLIFREVRRVLAKDGTTWLNLGDSYAGSGCGWGGGSLSELSNHHSKVHGSDNPRKSKDQKPPAGYKAKDLMGIPWRVAFALQDDGWWLRQDIIWHKPNPMPESVTDRCTKSHEYIFLLSKSAKYYFDQDAIKEPLKDASVARLIQDVEGQNGSDRVPGKTNGAMKAVRFGGNKYGDSDDFRTHSGNEWKPKGRDRSNGNRNGKGASTLDVKVRPHGIVRDRLLDYDSKESQLRPQVERGGYENESDLPEPPMFANKKSVWTVTTQPFRDAHFATFPPKLIEPCILAGSREGDTVLDPFNGAGTTGLVSLKHRRNYIGIELNPEYIKISEKRLAEVQINLF